MSNHIETKCIHGNLDFSWDEPTKAVSFPIYQTATFGHIGLGHSTGFDYTREKNPTRQHLEEILTALEGAYDTTAFSSGMAAVTAVFDLFAPGDHIICSEDLYGGVTRLVNTIGKKNGLMVDFVNTGDLDEIKRVLRPETKALYIETPSNPMMEITDLSACAELAKEHNLLMITDNTFLSPYLQNPIALGADIVIHSASKFLCGHNDTIAGFVCSAKEELAAKIRLIAKTTGGCLSPFDSWLVMRGIKTLAVRMERQQNKRAREYSLGMKQRLGLAEALLGRPPILILDEPTNGLDPSGIHEIRNLIKSLPALYDCTVLISSHMLSEIELIADDIGILNHGRLLFEGELDELRHYALQRGFSADYLEDMFLSMIEQDNLSRKQRAKL